jgi:hypothetical protein
MRYTLLPEESPVSEWREVSVEEFVAELYAGPRPSSRPLIAAIDGRSAAGKTSLSERLVKAASPAAVVHTDDVAWNQARFDWARLLVEGILRPARLGMGVSFRPPAWRRHGREGAIDVPATAAVLVVEGVGVGRDALASCSTG